MKSNRKPKVPRKELSAPSVPVSEAYVFDGRAFAYETERKLVNRANELKLMGIHPKLVAVITTRDPASELYIKLKKKAAERVGIEMEVFELVSNRRDYRFFLNLLAVFNRDPLVHGIMIQLPLAKRYQPYQKWIFEAIRPEKDVDGLREESPFMPATVKAIISIIEEAGRQVLLRKPPPVFVVGSNGAVGKNLLKHLTRLGYEAKGFDKRPVADWRDLWGVPSFMSLKADVVVSATGTPGLITAKHIAKGAAVIDVGSPKGDVRFREVKSKASFITPVPGGVGPVTIVSLLENLLEAAYNSQSITHSEG